MGYTAAAQIHGWMAVRLATEAPERLAAEALMVGFPGTEPPRELIARGIRSFILFGRNVGSAEEIRLLTAALRAEAGADALIAIDHEGGRVNRLAATGAAVAWPAPMAWAATRDLDLARRASAAMAAELRGLGITVNFAPTADLLSDHRNPVLGTRCFSDDPALAAAFAAAFAAGHQQAGVATTAKHFAGHGSTPIDSHLDLPTIAKSEERLRAEDLVPFEAAVRAGAGIMVSHGWYTAFDAEPTPATISPAVGRLARAMLGEEGVMVTDCMEMGAVRERLGSGEAAVRALQAGVDLVLVSHTAERQHEAQEAIAAAMINGRLPLSRLHASRRRVQRPRRQLQGEAPEPVPGEVVARELARKAVTLVRDAAGNLPLVPDRPVGVVAFAPAMMSQVEGRTAAPSPFIAEVARRFPAARTVTVTTELGTSEVVGALTGVDTVLVATSFVHGRPEQRAVVEALHRAGKRLVILAADPFDLLAFPQVPTALVRYDETPAMLHAALDVLQGALEPSGQLPVTLPAGSGS